MDSKRPKMAPQQSQNWSLSSTLHFNVSSIESLRLCACTQLPAASGTCNIQLPAVPAIRLGLGPQEGLEMAPRGPKMFLKRSKMAPRCGPRTKMMIFPRFVKCFLTNTAVLVSTLTGRAGLPEMLILLKCFNNFLRIHLKT